MKHNKYTKLGPAQKEELLDILKTRFEKNKNRHPDIEWQDVEARLAPSPEILWSLYEMERTGGEPDVAGYDKVTGEYHFFDFSAESPAGRRSVCYDREGLDLRKKTGRQTVQ